MAYAILSAAMLSLENPATADTVSCHVWFDVCVRTRNQSGFDTPGEKKCTPVCVVLSKC